MLVETLPALLAETLPSTPQNCAVQGLLPKGGYWNLLSRSLAGLRNGISTLATMAAAMVGKKARIHIGVLASA